jgi:hypothetical protein
MILDAFGPDAPALIIAGSLGGLMRGLIALRRKAAAGPLTTADINALAIDISTSVVIGAMSSLFLSSEVNAVVGPGLDMIHVDAGPKVLTSGFLAGLGGIAIIGYVLDFIDIRAKLKTQQAANPPAPVEEGKP